VYLARTAKTTCRVEDHHNLLLPRDPPLLKSTPPWTSGVRQVASPDCLCFCLFVIVIIIIIIIGCFCLRVASHDLQPAGRHVSQARGARGQRRGGRRRRRRQRRRRRRGLRRASGWAAGGRAVARIANPHPRGGSETGGSEKGKRTPSADFWRCFKGVIQNYFWVGRLFRDPHLADCELRLEVLALFRTSATALPNVKSRVSFPTCRFWAFVHRDLEIYALRSVFAQRFMFSRARGVKALKSFMHTFPDTSDCFTMVRCATLRAWMRDPTRSDLTSCTLKSSVTVPQTTNPTRLIPIK